MSDMDRAFDDWYRREYGWQGVIAYKGDQEERFRAAWGAALKAKEAELFNDAFKRAERILKRKKATRIALLTLELDELEREAKNEW